MTCGERVNDVLYNVYLIPASEMHETERVFKKTIFHRNVAIIMRGHFASRITDSTSSSFVIKTSFCFMLTFPLIITIKYSNWRATTSFTKLYAYLLILDSHHSYFFIYFFFTREIFFQC